MYLLDISCQRIEDVSECGPVAEVDVGMTSGMKVIFADNGVQLHRLYVARCSEHYFFAVAEWHCVPVIRITDLTTTSSLSMVAHAIDNVDESAMSNQPISCGIRRHHFPTVHDINFVITHSLRLVTCLLS